MRVLDDGIISGPKSVNLYLTNAPGVTNAFNAGTLDPSNNTATLYLVDNAGSISLLTTNLVVIEGQTAMLVFVRSGGTNGIVSVDYRLSGGSNGVDYASDLVTVSFGHGITVQTNFLPILRNPATNGMRIFTIGLTNAQGGALVGNPAQAVITVLDQDLGLLVPVGASILTESKLPANGMIDPGETVTVSIGLVNTGTVSAVNVAGLVLTAGGSNFTLTNGASYASNYYGAVLPNVGVVSRSFTFTAGTTGGQLVVPFAVTQTLPNGTVVTNIIYNFTWMLGSNTLKYANGNVITVNDWDNYGLGID